MQTRGDQDRRNIQDCIRYTVPPRPSIVVQDEFNSDVNIIIGVYEDDLIEKYLVDQELGLCKRKSSVCSPIDRLSCIGTNQL